jgi:CHAD domain-containing protein/CYTH domain-containing protein
VALPADLLQRPTREAVRRIALERLAALGEPAERLARPDDAEALHDLRVAIRRLRSVLRAYGPWLKGSAGRGDRRSLARLQRRTGAGRDAQACVERLEQWATTHGAAAGRGRRLLIERLEATVAEGRERTHERAERWHARRGARLERRLSRLTIPLEPEARERSTPFAHDLAPLVRVHAAAFLDGLARLADPEHAEEAHAVRIAGKRLRYLLEPLLGLVPGVDAALSRLKDAQEDLGALQDLAALDRAVADALEEAAVEHARALHQALGSTSGKPRDEARAGLLALAQSFGRERTRRWDALRERWCGGTGGSDVASLSAALDALVHAIGAQSGVEIERKFLLSGLPPLPAADVLEVEQGWLPGEVLQERVRRVKRGAEVACWRTLKAGRGVTRIELEERIDESLFERLWPLTEGLRVTKRRHVVADGSLTWEIDEFLDRDLALAEVELASPDQEAPLPAWLAPFVVRDVTDEDTYVNRRLAR